ncbi:MAG: ArsA family ATPase [Acidimicrobiia bacterium]
MAASASLAADTRSLLDHRLLVVTGKGGVGKTTITAGLARAAASLGKRVLLVEVDAKGDLPALFDRPASGFSPKPFAESIDGLAMDTEAALREYLKIYAKVPFVGKLGPLPKMLDFVAQAAPGVKEILVIGKICYEVKQAQEGKAPWDLVIVDASSTGHVIAQLGAARSLQNLIHVGGISKQLEWMEAILGDAEQSGLVVVCTPEEMPIRETTELLSRAATELSIAPVAVVMNRRIPDVFSADDRIVFERFRTGAVQDSVSAMVGPEGRTVIEGVALLDDICSEQAGYEAELRAAVAVPVSVVPAFFVRDQGTRILRHVSNALLREVHPIAGAS